MAYLKFNKHELVNLEYSLKREVLATNRAGGYASTTVICCNTRKYHGLLAVPVNEFGDENHILLSTLDETVIQHDQEFNLGIHKYPGTYEPRGHKYISDFEYDPIMAITYRVGGVILKKELLFVHNEEQIMIRYTLVDAHSETRLRLKPFLAYRSIHSLSKANMNANTKFERVDNGIKMRLYPGYPAIHMQLSKNCDFVADPDWYYNVSYSEEQERGYEYMEDLFVPGYFEMPIKKGESIIFSASVEEAVSESLKRKFRHQVEKRMPRTGFRECLEYSASQFIKKNGKQTEIIAGYPWFGSWGRDTLISLPGLTLAWQKDTKTCKAVLDTISSNLHNGLFPNIGKGENAAYNSVDAPLWYFWTLQKYEETAGEKACIWKNYGHKMKSILEAYRKGINEGIGMHENGLIWASVPGKALTWMDAVVDGIPVTPRAGYAVEINALWYNAVCYSLQLAEKAGDTRFTKDWENLPELIKESFNRVFLYREGNYLADYVDENGQNTFVRPNQIFACSLPYSPVSQDTIAGIFEIVTDELLTPKGLRTLSPKNSHYKGHCEGDQRTRDTAYHQGTIWPWLTGAYIETGLMLYGKQFLPKAKELLGGFEEDMTTYGICSIAEIYNGDPSYTPGGCISQAWSVAEVLRSLEMIHEF